MKGKILADWSKVDFRNPDHLKKMTGAFQAFMAAPQRNPKVRAALRHFTTKGDFPDEILQVLEKFHVTTNFDLGYEQIFDIRDFMGSNASGFDILDVQSGLAFAKVVPGDKAKVYKMSGAKASVSFDLYGGGLNYNQTWMDDGQYWNVEDTTIEFRNKAYQSKAENFYALIDAISSGRNLAWQGSSTDSEVNRDIKTINTACYNILNSVKNKGYGVGPNTMMVVLYPLAIKDRIVRAVTQLNQAVAGASKGIQYNIQLVPSLMLSSASVYYVCLPKAKSKGGYRMDLTLYNMFDILAYANTVAGWQRYGGAIGDTEQFQRCAIA